jgi:hypothetical protein
MVAEMDALKGTPEYAGLEIICVQGSSTPAYDLFDASGTSYGVFRAGDIVSAYVNFMSSTGTFYYVLQDFNDSFVATDHSTPSQIASQSDVEVVNTLSQGCTTTSGFCPQVKYTKLGIGSAYTGSACAVFFPVPCVFLSNNMLYPLGHLPTGTTYTKYEMISNPGSTIIATPSGFAADHSSFTITFKGAGP